MFGNWGRLPAMVVKAIVVVIVVPMGFIMIKGTIEAIATPAFVAMLQGYQVAMFTSLIPIGYIIGGVLWVFSDFIFPPPPGE